MCNINALFIKNKQKDITPFLMALSSNSYAINRDGDGIFMDSDSVCFKSKNKIDYNTFKDSIEKSRVIITHQRYSTSGHELEYTHPFTNEDFVLVHNGMIDQFKEKTGSDTFGFWNAFNKKFNAVKGTREERIKKTLTRLFKDNGGSYSILIYDKKTKLSYYFRNTPNIYFYQNSNYLIVSTTDQDVFFSMIDDIAINKFIELDIKPRILYRIEKTSEVFKIMDFPKISEAGSGERRKDEKIQKYEQNEQTSFYVDSFNYPICDKCGFHFTGKIYMDEDDHVYCKDCWKNSEVRAQYGGQYGYYGL